MDLSLYLVVNPHQCGTSNPDDTVLSAVRGGVTAVQLRSKTMSHDQLVELSTQTSHAVASYGIPVFINDQVAVAKDAQVDGVHLGQDDMSLNEARRILGARRLIGLTVRSMHEARCAPLECIDYLSIGGVFPTQSKFNPQPAIGIELLSRIFNDVRSRDPELPIIAISGIHEGNVKSVLETGVDGVAVVSAICESNHPRAAANRLKQMIKQTKHQSSIL